MQKYDQLEKNYNKLYLENEKLGGSYTKLLDKQELLQKDINTHKSDIDKLNIDLKNKNDENAKMTCEMESLTQRIDTYYESYGNPPQKEITDNKVLDIEDKDYFFLGPLEERNGNPFNSKQLEAIRYDMEENLRIIAGAGSGKTETITTKAAYLNKVRDVPEEKICMLTFTRKAALEMDERVSKNLGRKNEMRIGTFHSVFIKLVSELTERFYFEDVSLNFKSQVDENKYIRKIEQLIDKYNLKELNTYEGKSLKERLSCWINAGYDNSEICENVRKYLDKELSKEGISEKVSDQLHNLIEELKIIKEEENILIFDDYLTKIPELISKNKEAQEYLRDRFSYIFIDEFQDTNQLQINVIQLIAPPKDNKSAKLIIVGDDDQAIYLFRGSETKFIKDFDNDYSTVTIDLMTNYRSKAKEVVRMANSLIINNRHDRLEKPPMECAPFSVAEKYEVQKVLCHDDILEAKFVVDKIKEYASKSWYEGVHTKDQKEVRINKEDKVPDYAKNVVLYRMRNQAESLITKLEMNNIEFVIKGDKNEYLGVFNDSNFKKTFEIWKEYYLAKDSDSLLVVRKKLMINIANLFYMKTTRANEIVKRYNLSETFIDAAKKILEDIVKETKSKWQNQKDKVDINKTIHYISDVEELAAENNIDIYKLSQQLKVFKVYNTMTRNNPEKFNQIISTCKETKTIEGLMKLYDIKNRIYRDMKKRYDLYLEDKLNALCLMTIHQSKGLSFENVFVIGNYEGGLPHSKAKSITKLEDKNYFKIGNPPTLLEEERRLFYVALTRAKENLHVTFPILQGDQSLKPSRFLKELGKTKLHVVK